MVNAKGLLVSFSGCHQQRSRDNTLVFNYHCKQSRTQVHLICLISPIGTIGTPPTDDFGKYYVYKSSGIHPSDCPSANTVGALIPFLST